MRSHIIRRNWIYRLYMLAKAKYAYHLHCKPGKSMTYIGITGTDGKSTTSMCTYHILKSAGYKVGILSTVYLDIGQGIQDNTTHLTSVSHTQFRSYISQAEASGYTHMVVEVSSHALYQYRTRPLRFDSVGITNLTREHLDFHWTMEHYAATKAELFGRLKSGGSAFLPDVLPHSGEFQKYRNAGQQRQAFGSVAHSSDNDSAITHAGRDIYSDHIQEHPQLECDIYIGNEKLHIYTSQIGRFNIDNMMLAAGLCASVGCGLSDIQSGLNSFGGLPGRQELVTTEVDGHMLTAMIDFALTPDALEILYRSTREMGFSYIIVVFGATGDRDQGKRPEMGGIAATYADEIIITEDENYSEDGKVIMQAIYTGADAVDDGLVRHIYIRQDRVEAIQYGAERLLEIASSDLGLKPILVVTGMANFAYRQMGTEKQDWNEKGVIEGAFGRLSSLRGAKESEA